MLKSQLGFTLVALCFCHVLFAQEPRIHISGQIIDKENKELTEDEFWSFGTYDLTPFIQYDKMAWDQLNLTTNPDYDKIQSDLGKGMTLQEKYEERSGTWFTEPDRNHIEGLKTAQKKVSELNAFFR